MASLWEGVLVYKHSSRIWTDFNKTRTNSTGFHKKTPISNFTKIRPEGSALIYTDGRTDEWADGNDEANFTFFAIVQRA
jgi:hypothetical protein